MSPLDVLMLGYMLAWAWWFLLRPRRQPPTSESEAPPTAEPVPEALVEPETKALERPFELRTGWAVEVYEDGSVRVVDLEVPDSMFGPVAAAAEPVESVEPAESAGRS